MPVECLSKILHLTVDVTPWPIENVVCADNCRSSYLWKVRQRRQLQWSTLFFGVIDCFSMAVVPIVSRDNRDVNPQV
jgi:predicted nucleic acid-binding Zn ribbon protein